MKKIMCLAASALMLLSGCGKKTANNSVQASRDVFAMDTYMNLKAYGENAEDALRQAESEILHLEELLSVTNENSDISVINSANGSSVAVAEDTAKIIAKALEIGDITDGALDISVYPVLREWGFTAGEYKIPEKSTLDALLENVDYRRIRLEDCAVTVPAAYQLDLGALAKGYTSDRVMEILRENGVESAVISLGGNVRTLGRKPDGSQWKIAVTDPFVPESSLAVVEVSDKAVITSGNYERYFMGEDGVRYHHIIDPEDGFPADNGLVSVTIIAESGIMCDALSTALFVSGYEKAVDIWREHGNFDMILIDEDGMIYITPGIEESFSLSGNFHYDMQVIQP